MDDSYKKYTGKGKTHQGPDRTSPYPVSRLAPAIQLVDLAREIEQADKVVNVRVSSKLKVVADQIRVLQAEARKILEEANQDQDLHHVQCNFKKIPGHIYHLYQKADGRRYFSMLSPDDWKGKSPHQFLGSFFLGADMSWRPAGEERGEDATDKLVQQLLDASA